VAAVVVLLLLIAAFTLRHQAPARVPAPPAPTAQADTPQGAVQAAVADVAAYGSDALFDPVRRHLLIAQIADPSVAQALQAHLDATIPSSAEQLGLDGSGQPPAGQQLVVRTVPVGAHVASYDANTAQVAVWTTGLVGLTGKSSTHPVAAAWSTATVSLHWTGTAWKWLSFSQVDGPTPVAADQVPSGSDTIAAASRDFTEPAYAR
jgi:hypothetical protein